MAIFKKKSDSGDKSNGQGVFTPQPEKARVWFKHAETAADTRNYAYALACYAAGIKLDPETMSAHEAMLAIAQRYRQAGGKPATSKEIKGVGDENDVAKFAQAEFAWMKDLTNGSLALKAIGAAAKASMYEYAAHMAPIVLNLLRQSKKQTKSMFVQAKDLFAEAQAWTEAITAGEIAMSLDPSDGTLANEIKDLSAQRAMDRGGYERALDAGSGGFRGMIRDEDKQRELEEGEAISGSASVEERNLIRARQDYVENPESPDAINKLAQLLRRTATEESEAEALDIYEKGFNATGEYRFKMAVGDVQIDRLNRKLKTLDEELESDPDDDGLKAERETVRRDLLERQSKEYRERVQKYPTDRVRKYELGQVEFELGHYEDAMEQFQKSKDEPKLKVRAGLMLGRCFASEGWHQDAIAEFRETLESMDGASRDVEQEVKYALMTSLLAHATEERSIDIAKDALDICSGIMRKNIGFKDIRAQRKAIDALIKELS